MLAKSYQKNFAILADVFSKTPHILVTGATGFIGQHLLKQLHAAGYHIWIITRPTSRVNKEIKQLAQQLVFTGNVDQLAQQLKKAQITGIIHLASLFLSHHTAKDIPLLIQSNILFGTQLLEAATKANLKWFINTGTFWQHYQNEPYSPVNLYAASKQAFLDIAKYYYQTYQLNFVTLELSDTFGPNDTRPKLIALWQKIAQTGETLNMSAGEQRIDLNHVDNITAAFLHAVTTLIADKQMQHCGKSYMVSSGQVVTIKELAEIFQQVTGQKLKIAWGKLPYRPREVMQPWSQGEPLPGWQPRISLKEGLRKI